MRNSIFVGLSLTLLATPALAADLDPVEPAAQIASEQAFHDFGAETGARVAGMPPREKMDRASLGKPIALKLVQLDDLQRYVPGARGGDPSALVRDLATVIVPIRLDGKAHGEMVMRKVGGTWSPRGFAGPARVEAIEKARRGVVENARVREEATELVYIPALRLELIAHRDASGLQLTPLADLPAAGLKGGQTLPAARVFELLAPVAKQHNGLPS